MIMWLSLDSGTRYGCFFLLSTLYIIQILFDELRLLFMKIKLLLQNHENSIFVPHGTQKGI